LITGNLIAAGGHSSGWACRRHQKNRRPGRSPTAEWSEVCAESNVIRPAVPEFFAVSESGRGPSEPSLMTVALTPSRLLMAVHVESVSLTPKVTFFRKCRQSWLAVAPLMSDRAVVLSHRDFVCSAGDDRDHKPYRWR